MICGSFMLASGRFSAMRDPSKTGDPHDAFVYDAARAPFPPLGATAYVYDAMREPVRPYNAPLVTLVPSLQTAGTGSYPALAPTAAGVRGLTFLCKQHGAETGLDYFGARYFSGAQGRFTSPDPEIIPRDITNPRVWNKYAYTLNNPLSNVDPDGRATLPAEVQQALQRFAPTALSLISPAAKATNATLTVLDLERRIGLMPAMNLEGPNTPQSEIEQGRQVAAMTGNDIIHVDRQQ
jgi:RHS repeat-associated protein